MSEVTLLLQGNPVSCDVQREGDQFVVRCGPDTQRLRLAPLEPGLWRLSSDGRSYTVTVACEAGRCYLHVGGHVVEFSSEEARPADAAGRDASQGDLTAPMPGTVTEVLIRDGDDVVTGQPLVIVEAMKMEHVIRAPRAARIRALRVRPGDQVDAGAVVAQIDGGSGDPAR